MKTAVVAVGGNALTRSNQVGTIAEQYENASATCGQLARMVAQGWNIVLTHGNGPQVGNVLLRVELAADQVYTLPLDICDADTQGGIGYMLQQVLGNELLAIGIQRTVVTLVTQVLVDERDPAFAEPSKPIGPFFHEAAAKAKMTERGWNMREDAGRGWRRVVPSPKPLRIVELSAIQSCVAQGFVVIAGGGGGVPVIEVAQRLRGVEAVVDKDRVSSLLAEQLEVDLLVILTGVPQVAIHFGKPEQRNLERVSARELRGFLEAGEFPAGSMGPKIESALAFVESGPNREVIITDEASLVDALDEKAGTRVVS